MNKLILYFTFILCFSCAKAPYLPYHSTVEIPRITDQTETIMKLVQIENVLTSYCVISAIDNDTLDYLLLAPEIIKPISGLKKNLWDYDISFFNSNTH